MRSAAIDNAVDRTHKYKTHDHVVSRFMVDGILHGGFSRMAKYVTLAQCELGVGPAAQVESRIGLCNRTAIC